MASSSEDVTASPNTEMEDGYNEGKDHFIDKGTI